ncbi:hypothetical protein KZY44_004276 [Vibrio vulnificus]|uniref:TfuA-like protein n=1 Tax=Vibrio vulnificus TaxID=672 RepID=UPI0005F2755A|nr:TfuA-like protein [Vibrio vulnificus]EHU9455766.1 hypothetical protein [Vibrio vulnificus]EJA3102944.1 hypothetical protein [Vibrio vulnificus]EJE8546753.1 hypothetical protein [Vibrio vulnificus]ELX4137166.1 hypothetical protein [Vibrio vulnificus]
MYCFVGPTGYKVDTSDWNCKIYPPVRRGDIYNLVKKYNPSIIIIVDGVFHKYPAVLHKEILAAISLGWRVVGCSSMGAIRASELYPFGMEGYGYCFRAFIENGLDDDEVTLIHDEESYLPFSVPLINVRYYLESKLAEGKIDLNISNEIIDSLKSLYYGDRTLTIIKKIFEDKEVCFDVNEFKNNYDIKRDDFILCLKKYL